DKPRRGVRGGFVTLPMPEKANHNCPEPHEAESAESSALQKSLSRPSAKEIFTQVAANARQELKRTTIALGISGVGGGAFLGLTALAVAFANVLLGSAGADHLLAAAFYPIGFIVVIVGRSQLFTENTLYPVALVL